jgi:hypothetical protein
MSKETIAINISQDVIDFINERIAKKQFADVSHGFELMAFEYMQAIKDKDSSTLDHLERMARDGVKRSVVVVKETAGTVQDSTMKVYKESSEKVRESGIMQDMLDKAGRVQESTMKAVKISTEKAKESVGKVKESVLSKDGEEKEEDCKGCIKIEDPNEE